jgi:ABC-2 type transport system permease protein
VIELRRWVGTFRAMAGVELRQWSRHRSAVACATLLPVAMAALISLALGREVPADAIRVRVVDHDHSPASAAFVDDALGDPSLHGLVEVVAPGDEDEGVDVVVTLPAGLDRRLRAGDPGIRIGAADAWGGDLVRLVVDQYVARARVAAIAVARTGAPPTGDWPLTVEVRAPGGRRLDAATHYGPGVGMFFVLVTMGFAAQRVVADRRRGLIDRLALAPGSPSAVWMGRISAAVAVGGLSLAVMAAAMQLLFGRSWGPPLLVAATIAAVVVALAGVGALLAALARTPDQASMLAAGVGFAFAVTSGSFSPPGAIGGRPRLAALVPTTYALDGFATLATQAADIGPVVGAIVALLLFGVAGLVASGAVVRRWS